MTNYDKNDTKNKTVSYYCIAFIAYLPLEQQLLTTP